MLSYCIYHGHYCDSACIQASGDSSFDGEKEDKKKACGEKKLLGDSSNFDVFASDDDSASDSKSDSVSKSDSDSDSKSDSDSDKVRFTNDNKKLKFQAIYAIDFVSVPSLLIMQH